MKSFRWFRLLSFSLISALIMSGFVTVPSSYAANGNTFRIVGTDGFIVGSSEYVQVNVELDGQVYDPDYDYRLVFLDYSKNQTNPEVIVPYTSDCNLWWEEGCLFYLGDSENISTGFHQIGAVIEKSNNDLRFNQESLEDVHSLNDVGEVVQEVDSKQRYYFYKTDSLPVLGQSSKYFTSNAMSDYEEKYPEVLIKWNSYSYEDKYIDYMYEITNDKIIGYEFPLDKPPSTGHSIDTTNDDYLQYQIIRAKYKKIEDVQTKSDLEDIQYESNIVEFERRLWSIGELYPSDYGKGRPDFEHIDGGGDRSIYLEDNTTGEIIWSTQDDIQWDELLDWEAKPNYGHTPLEDVSWATYWVADKWEGEFSDRPKNVNDLTNKIANNRGLKDSIPDSQSGIQNTEQVAGGHNPIEQCINQSCKADPVNLFTGEFFETSTDLRGVGNAMIPDSTRSFSTIRKDKLGVMGYGWRNAYEMGLESDSNSLVADEEIRFVQENGATSYFYKQTDGTYKTSASVNLKVRSDGKFEMSNKLDHTITVFSSTGKFEKVSDINDNSLTMTYANGKFSRALSSNGSYIDFAYNSSGLLKSATSDTGDTVNYTYNSNKQLISIKNQDNVVFDYTYDAKRRVKTLTNAMGGVTTNTYDTENRVTRQVDPLGGIYRFVYNTDGLNSTTEFTKPNGLKVRELYQEGYLVSKIESPDTTNEKKWSYSYDRNNDMTATIAPDGSMTSMTYDDNHNPLTVRNALGGLTKFTYNDRGQVLTVEDHNGNVTHSRYDAKGNLIEIEDALGNITKYNWDTSGKLLNVVDARGVANPAVENDYKTIYSYTAKGLLESTTNPENGIISQTYDSKGRADSMTSPNGNATPVSGDYTSEIAYGANNLPSKNIDAEDNETSYTYDIAGNILTSTDAMGNVTSFTYDLLGQVLTLTTEDGTTTYEYNKNGDVVKEVDSKGNIVLNTFNTAGYLTKTTDAKGNITTYTYDLMGNVLTVKDPMGKTTKFSYDKAGNLTLTTDPLGNVTGSVYDQQGRTISSFDDKYNFTSYTYDELNRNISTTLPTGATTTVKYDEVGNMVERINGEGDSEYWAYDSLNRVTSYTDQEGNTKTYSYDKDSQPTTTTREDNSVINTQYSETGRVQAIDYPGTARDLSYDYDALGRVTSEKLGNGTPKTTSYDHAGRVLAKNGIAYEYDELGNQTKITYPSGRNVDYVYDANSNLTTADISGIGMTTYTYNKNDAITTTQLPNGVTETNTRDSLGRVTAMTMNNPTQELHKYTKTYDSVGNMSGSTYGLLAQKKTENYTHDVVNRLTNVSSDITGNTTENDYNLANHLVKFDGKNVIADKIGKPEQIGTQELTYDVLGNRTNIQDSANSAHVETYEWSVDNLLEGANKGTATEVDYQYDAGGLLSTRTENTQTDNFLWDETATNALLLSDGDYEYVYGANRVPLAQIDLTDSSIEYLHTDINGSVIAVTGTDGYLSGITNYGAYGKRQGSAISRIGYAGEWTDPTTTYTYLRARWYDPSTGHFLSKDPLYELTQESYGYANGNPLMNIDPSGLFIIPPAPSIVESTVELYSDATSNTAHYTDMSIKNRLWNSHYLKFMDSEGYAKFTDASAGIGDIFTLGGGSSLRKLLNIDNSVDECSSSYKVGGIIGTISTLYIPGVASIGNGSKLALITQKSSGIQNNINFKNLVTSGQYKGGIKGLQKINKKGSSYSKGGGHRDRYTDDDGFIYETDNQHGTLEKYNKRGKHLGEVDYNGNETKPANSNRRIKP